MKTGKQLLLDFQPQQYKLYLEPDRDGMSFNGHLVIFGKKTGRPSQRITLHQKGLKINTAKITSRRKGVLIEQEVIRINHLPTFEQVRLHTASLLYPGEYIIELSYQLNPEKLQALKDLKHRTPRRDLMPSIDEPKAWSSATFNFKQP